MAPADPLLCDLPAQVTPEEIGSQVALEYGQAMTVRVPVVVVQNASVLDLKKAIQRFVQLKQERAGGIQHISWKYVWRTYCLTFGAEKLTDDRKKLREGEGASSWQIRLVEGGENPITVRMAKQTL
uniref:SNRNP25 ubiquitin-like domain-containing protein n=1 Tax=Podarcis muralis TaxID=64176 RepID=A0A670JLD0_PODMU